MAKSEGYVLRPEAIEKYKKAGYHMDVLLEDVYGSPHPQRTLASITDARVTDVLPDFIQEKNLKDIGLVDSYIIPALEYKIAPWQGSPNLPDLRIKEVARVADLPSLEVARLIYAYNPHIQFNEDTIKTYTRDPFLYQTMYQRSNRPLTIQQCHHLHISSHRVMQEYGAALPTTSSSPQKLMHSIINREYVEQSLIVYWRQ